VKHSAAENQPFCVSGGAKTLHLREEATRVAAQNKEAGFWFQSPRAEEKRDRLNWRGRSKGEGYVSIRRLCTRKKRYKRGTVDAALSRSRLKKEEAKKPVQTGKMEVW